MTVLEDRIEMADADANTKRLDEWFERLERMPVPEGHRVEIVGGNRRRLLPGVHSKSLACGP
jgi:hypothetical protein